RLVFHLAPPLLGTRKRAFGPWMLPVFLLLARAKGLRGGWLDPFGHTAEWREDRRLLAEHVALIERICRELTPERHALAVQLAGIP
uniref:DUF6537 domain-containing protein n=1 Tax=Proteus terrae TaxID=1574161 RepID=UPI001CBC5737